MGLAVSLSKVHLSSIKQLPSRVPLAQSSEIYGLQLRPVKDIRTRDPGRATHVTVSQYQCGSIGNIIRQEASAALFSLLQETFRVLSHSPEEVGFPHSDDNHRCGAHSQASMSFFMRNESLSSRFIQPSRIKLIPRHCQDTGPPLLPGSHAQCVPHYFTKYQNFSGFLQWRWIC